MNTHNIAVPIPIVNRNTDCTTSDTGDMGRDVGVRLRHARKLRGLKQKQLEKASGVSQAAISEVETGESRSSSGTNLVALAQALQVRPEWLATGKPPMEPVDTPLPIEAIRLAQDWLKLAPEVRASVARMVSEMVRSSSADSPAIPDAKVAKAYGRPGKPKIKR